MPNTHRSTAGVVLAALIVGATIWMGSVVIQRSLDRTTAQVTELSPALAESKPAEAAHRQGRFWEMHDLESFQRLIEAELKQAGWDGGEVRSEAGARRREIAGVV